MFSYHGFVYALLRSVWAEPRPSRPPPRGRLDWALVGVLVPTALLEGLLRQDVPYRPVAIVVTVGLTPTLLWRRTHPLLMIVISFVVSGLAPLLMGGQQTELVTLAYAVLLPYALFRWGSGREAVIGAAVMLTQLGYSSVAYEVGAGDILGATVVVFAVTALGLAARYRAKARTRELDQAKLLERERLARDLHDTVAHHVSAMAIRAQAGLATAQADPDAAVDALRLIEAEASRALTEMRGLVRLLRKHEPAELAPSPGIGELEQLARRSLIGPRVDVTVDGDLDDLPPVVATALYRLAQEAVTNARRHARHASRIDVRVGADDTSAYLRVTDDGDSSAAGAPGSAGQGQGRGYGVIGMTERAGLLGGTCEAGPNPGRGWTVSAVLPRTGPPA